MWTVPLEIAVRFFHECQPGNGLLFIDSIGLIVEQRLYKHYILISQNLNHYLASRERTV
jgi:hypothetical protein